MIQVAIVEDEPEIAQELSGYIRRYAQERKLSIRTQMFRDGAAFVDEYKGDCQIVFMDIAMPHVDGLHAAHYLREIDSMACLIFVTNMAQYAIRGYEVAALDYVLKPLKYDLFVIKMDKAVAHIKTDEEYHIRIANGTKKVRLSELVYIESSKHYLYFHTANENYRMRGSMKEIKEFFLAKGFALLNGSILVNLAYIEEVHGNDILIAGECMAVGRVYKAELLERLADYMGGAGM